MSAATGEFRALVVDDEEDLARLVADYLHRDGFITQVALAGEQALECARASSKRHRGAGIRQECLPKLKTWTKKGRRS